MTWHSPRIRAEQFSRWILASWVALLGVHSSVLLLAQDAPPAAAKPVEANKPVEAKPPAEAGAEAKGPIGQFVTIANPVDAGVYGKINRIGTALQARAQQERRKAILVLEITDGPSRFGDVRELALYLSTELPSVTTVAWVPKDLRGNNVILALACNEIILAPKASLGDIGRGKVVEPDAQSFVVNMVNRRHNPKLSEALVSGMMDPQKEIVWVRLKTGEPPQQVTETRVISPAEFDRLIRGKAVIEEQQTIKAPGTDGIFNGAQARALNVLITQTAETRADVAKLYQLPREAQREDPAAGKAPIARRIRIEGMIDHMQSQFTQRQIQRSLAQGASLLIFEIESPGGTLLDSLDLAHAISDLDPKQVRTVAYIPERAISGAAIVSLGCDEIYMHPNASMGDAGPIEMREDGVFHRAEEKIVSILQIQMKELAEAKHRPAALAMAMANRELDVFEATNSQTGEIWFMTDDEIHASNGDWIKGRLVPESADNLLLTVTGVRGNELHLTEPPVENLEELKQRLGIPAEETLPAVGPTWVDTLVYLLNTSFVTGLLFVVGILCIYAELHVTTGVFGIAASVCFGLFFWSRFLGGTADWLEVVLFLIGIGCIGIEIFITPGFGVFGVSGALLLIASLILASQTFLLPATQGDFRELSRSMGTLSGAIAGFIVAAVIISRFLPRMPLWSHMVLVPPGHSERLHPNEPQLRPEYAPRGHYSPLDPNLALLGKSGEAVTILRPAGKARIDERMVDVVSDGPFIEQGATVQVVEVLGNRIVVRQA